VGQVISITHFFTSVTNWDAMELLWRHAYQELRVVSAEHPVLLIEKSNKDQAKAVQFFFEVTRYS
jgi:actin-related protein